MDLHVWLAFLVASCVIAVSPGSGAVLSMSHGLSYGVRRTTATIVGLQLGLAVILLVAGLGGCPFAAHKGAAGNVCTEDLVFMLDEMGIETGIDLDKLIEVAQLAEDIVGHPLPGSVKMGGSLKALRERLH